MRYSVILALVAILMMVVGCSDDDTTTPTEDGGTGDVGATDVVEDGEGSSDVVEGDTTGDVVEGDTAEGDVVEDVDPTDAEVDPTDADGEDTGEGGDAGEEDAGVDVDDGDVEETEVVLCTVDEDCGEGLVCDPLCLEACEGSENPGDCNCACVCPDDAGC